ncbi:MAG: phage major capsid protein [Acidimicrobiia bacterium]|nr:phage major capsid protein [Acidimicrobiia bacterium]
MTRRPTILDSIDAMRAETRDAARGLLDRAEAEGRDLTDLERREYEKHMSDLEGLNERYEDLKAEVERRQNAERTAAEFNGNTSTRTAPQTSTAPPSQTAPLVRVGGEPTVYETREHSYVRDLVARAVHQDADATGRLAQHATQVRAMSTDVATAGAEFVPPAYLVQDYAEKARSLRSAANLVTVLGLPGGVDAVNIPRVTTGGKVAPQASQNASVTTQDLVTTETSADLVTIAGYVDVSVQYLEQSPDAARAEDVVFTDLLGALEEETERQVIEGSGASGELLGLLTLGGTGSVSYTDTSPTAGELYPKVAESINDVVTGRHRLPKRSSCIPAGGCGSPRSGTATAGRSSPPPRT